MPQLPPSPNAPAAQHVEAVGVFVLYTQTSKSIIPIDATEPLQMIPLRPEVSDPGPDETEEDTDSDESVLWDAEACAQQNPPPPVGLAGGVLYHLGEYSGGLCGGSNEDALVSEVTTLHDNAAPQTPSLRPGFTCVRAPYTEGALFESLTTMDWSEGCVFGSDGCSPPVVDATAVTVANGERIAFVGDRAPFVSDESWTCVHRTPLSAEMCPSVRDPCGSARAFPMLVDAPLWWVSTDESVAMSVDGDVVRVFLRGKADPIRAFELPGETVVGAEFHEGSAASRQGRSSTR